MKRILAISLCLAVLAGCAGGPPRIESNETLQRYLSYAGDPIDRFTTMTGIDGWESVADDRLVLRTGINKAYLVTVWRCPDLAFAQRIRVDQAMSSSLSRFDKVIVGRDVCPIREIRPIDVRQMKADRKQELREKQS